MRLKRETRRLKAKAVASLRRATAAFNGLEDEGREATVLLFLQHAFEMLLKAGLHQRGVRLFDQARGRSIGFEKCVRLGYEHLDLTEDQAGLLRTIDALRDDEQHWLGELSEGLLYVHARAAITLFDDLLQAVFGERLAAHLPERVLPISTRPPSDLDVLIDEQYRQVRELLRPRRRQRTEARSLIRGLLAMEGHRTEGVEISERDVTRVERAVRDGRALEDVFPRLVGLGVATEGEGVLQTGRVQPANRESFRRFLARFDGQPLVAAVEAMTGWRFIVEELTRVGAEVHLAEPAETSSKRGPKRRAKTDRLDARLMRELLVERRLPEAWIAPAHILDLRARVRLRKTLVDQRTEWLQRIHAVLFHHGVPTQAGRLGRLEGDHAREQLACLELPHAAEQQIAVALAIVEHLNALLRPIELELERDARRLHGCRALMAHYGIGARVATAIVAELGDPRRFSSSRQAVRCAGLDITVHESDARRRGGHLSRQGSPVLRWAVFEAAQTAARPGSPDHAYYLELKDRLGANRAALTIARKMLRRAHHTLRALGDDALAPA